MSELISIITASDPQIRNRALDEFGQRMDVAGLLAECAALEQFRHTSDSLYEQVRALFFLYAIHRFHLPRKAISARGKIPFDGYSNLLSRRFEEAIEIFLSAQARQGPTDGLSSALAVAYHNLAFQTLADQVRRSVRSVRGNQWMFRIGHSADHPLRVQPALYRSVGQGDETLFPILREATPVRADLTHSGWSDIFFLGMDYPAGARVLNISVDLSVRDFAQPGSSSPRPPIETYFRVIDQPILRLVSVDLGVIAEISNLGEVFDFAKDYTGLLKAAIIASGIIPPGIEGAEQPLSELLARLIAPGYGIELVSQVNGIPKGSRLAVSTNLLASLIAVCMRATGQTESLTGPLTEAERRIVAARAILGEWIGGSGGGWQDSGGVWPGIKLIEGVEASEGDPEFGVSRGRLLPNHHILTLDEISAETRQRLQASLVMVHGGMAQDVGPILEMVTEKYLLRSEAEWQGRLEAVKLIDQMLAHLAAGDIRGLGAATQRNFSGPIQTIIPWATNLYTETLIRHAQSRFGDQFWGFWMMGGMSGGGMGFMFDPTVKEVAQAYLYETMGQTKQSLEAALPFAMEPVVYDFAINEQGTSAEWLSGPQALMPPGYYTLTVPQLLRHEQRTLSPFRRAELDRFGVACRTDPQLSYMVPTLFDRLLPQAEVSAEGSATLTELLGQYGFDPIQHEQIRADLRSGRIGLAQNRLPVSSRIEDVRSEDVAQSTQWRESEQAHWQELGQAALADGQVAIISLAGGAGSRWTQGAGVVKALNPFCKLGGQHRNFIAIHLAKSRRAGRLVGRAVPHVLTTSYLTHEPIERYVQGLAAAGYREPLYLSQGRSVGLRLIPMARDLRFAWEEMPQQLLDERAQKMQDSVHTALLNWARSAGEGNDYTDNLPMQCLHPVGHWVELPNLLRNGLLLHLLEQHPNLRYLMMHNIDTMGVDVGSPLGSALLGYHIERGAAMTTEVITRRIEDRGGGLARIDGSLRLIEGLAMPREELEFELTYYNSATYWIDIEQMLALFGLTREQLTNRELVAAAVRAVAARMPTYITLKEVKRRWGKGQEDIFPVVQFEKLWGDMTGLPTLNSQFVAVPRQRGQQLKEVAQLDGWLRDGSAAYVESLCDWV